MSSESGQKDLLHAAVDLLVDRTRAVADLAAAAGGVRGALPPILPAAVTQFFASLEQLADQMPRVGEEFKVVVDEIHAKRLSIQSLQAELGVLDQQLEVLEKVLAPLEAWTHQWERLRKALAVTPSGSPD